MDIYERLKADHDEARDLMGQIKKAGSDKKRAELFEYFMRDMWLHHKLEEAETFAEAREVLDDKVAKKMGKQFDDRKKVLIAALEPVDYSQ